ncbi:acyltransferase family protein [Butyrivibrio fibrisolvens]|uniref:acyltransferase family protein n=1 Tax=Butyrivibrio fibrisolvens TaxID=831 RepID=UPI000415DDCA|nr:acyltransferase family protein [Butyrivibrio fibrisolvens]
MNENKYVNRQTEIDIARGAVIILMILGHSEPPEVIHKVIYGFHMPFFFILSGILFNKDKWMEIGLKKYIYRRWGAYIVPYFIFSAINLLLNIPVEYVHGIKGNNLLISTLKHIFWILYSGATASRTPNCTPLWFLPCTFLSCIFLFLLYELNNYIYRVFLCLVGSIIVLLTDYTNAPILPWQINIALLGMSFMYIGHIIREKNVLDSIHEYRIVYIILALVGGYCILSNNNVDLAANMIGNIVLMYIGALSISILVLLVSRRYLYKFRILELFGKNTILFMAFNYTINGYSRWVFLTVLHFDSYPWWLITIMNLFVLWIMCIIWNEIKKKYPKISF